MSAELDDVYNGLFSGKVPALWMGKGYPSLCPIASWFDDLLERLAFLQVRCVTFSATHRVLPLMLPLNVVPAGGAEVVRCGSSELFLAAWVLFHSGLPHRRATKFRTLRVHSHRPAVLNTRSDRCVSLGYCSHVLMTLLLEMCARALTLNVCCRDSARGGGGCAVRRIYPRPVS
eukprot:COSAG01_NODE_2678_length_7262_cov_9.427893_2_plen_174_part_00